MADQDLDGRYGTGSDSDLVTRAHQVAIAPCTITPHSYQRYIQIARDDNVRARGYDCLAWLHLSIWECQQGTLLLRQGHAEDALQHFRAALQQRAVEWNIDSFEDCLANTLLEVGRNDEAIAEYERIQKINPNYPLAQQPRAQNDNLSVAICPGL